jgi:hypothetical protein
MRIMTWSLQKWYKHIQQMWWRECGLLWSKHNMYKDFKWGQKICQVSLFLIVTTFIMYGMNVWLHLVFHKREKKLHYILKIRRHNIHKLNEECVSHVKMYRIFLTCFCRKTQKHLFFWGCHVRMNGLERK